MGWPGIRLRVFHELLFAARQLGNNLVVIRYFYLYEYIVAPSTFNWIEGDGVLPPTSQFTLICHLLHMKAINWTLSLPNSH